MFWQRKKAAEEPSAAKGEKLPKPKELPGLVGQQLVTELKQNPDWVWKLKIVTRPRADGKDRFDFRIFDETQVLATKTVIKDYNSFNELPELVMFDGWFDKKAMKVQFDKKKGAPA